MTSIKTDLKIILEKHQWESFITQMAFLCEQFNSTEMIIGDHFIDLRRISPVPRCHVTRIYFRAFSLKIEIYKAKIFSLDSSYIPWTSEHLKQDIEFILEDFI